MRHPFARILVTLAASELKLEEIYRFFHWVADNGPGHPMPILEEIRDRLGRYDHYPFETPRIARSSQSTGSVRAASNE